MPIPRFDECLRPLLAALSAADHLHINDATARVADHFGLSQAEREVRLPSGGETMIRNRVGWARTFLNKAGLIAQVSRGHWRITDDGHSALGRFPYAVTVPDLRSFPAFQRWTAAIDASRVARIGEARVEADADSAAEEDHAETPELRMAGDERRLRALLEEALLERVSAMAPGHFEWLVERLVVGLGYGSSSDEVTRALRQGGADGGVDGVIKEDRLGLGQIYLQAKRWRGNVGRPEIQSFVGAMHGRAQKGVFIATSDFTREAREYADSLQGLRIRLIDGKELAGLMVDCGLGVSEERVYRTYRIDSDFFEAGE